VDTNKLIDAHRHFTLDVSEPADLIEELDNDAIEKTVLFGFHGFSFAEKYAQDKMIEKMYLEYPNRIIPFLCDLDPGDSQVTSYVEKKLSEGVFKGLGEILFGHKIIKEMYFNEISYSHSAVISLFKTAGEFNVPVLVHVDPPYQKDFETALKECGNTVFVWAHAAYDFLFEFGGKERTTDEIRNLLDTYPNLHFDISHWKISPVYMLSEPWKRLLEEYSDRFLFGTDMTDSYKDQAVWIPCYKKILGLIDKKCSTVIGRDNVLRICNCL